MADLAPDSSLNESPVWLLVDDDELFRERLARALAQRGFVVFTAANHDEALAVASRASLDRAVVDLRMPGKSGLEVVRGLKQLDEELEVLVLSGFGSIATAIEAVKLGATNFLPKPADLDDIMNAFDSSPEEKNVMEAHEVPSLARAEWEHIHRVLSDCGGNVSEAARRLGIHRRSLQRKLRKRAPD